MQNNYFILSDTHFGHSNILDFERGNRFSTIQEHNVFMVELIEKGLRKLGENDVFYFLGDWGLVDDNELQDRLLAASKTAVCRKVAILGNHDKEEQIAQLMTLGFDIHEFPLFINKRVVLSHHPCIQQDPSVLNVSGHLHGWTLDYPNYLCASVAVCGYRLVSRKEIDSKLGSLPRWCQKFLYEPYAGHMIAKIKRDDCVVDKNNHIDLAASRVWKRLKDEQAANASIQESQAMLS